MFAMRPGLPSSEVAANTPVSFQPAGQTGAGGKLSNLLNMVNDKADQFSPLIQLMMGGGPGGGQGGGGQQPQLTGTGQQQPTPQFQPGQIPIQTEEDPLAFLRAFGVQG
jgi:hypothetical protein